ncbi:hypothetical protein D3C85_1109420 [compost metagenome]
MVIEVVGQLERVATISQYLINGLRLVRRNPIQISAHITAQHIVDDFQHRPGGESAVVVDQQILQVRAAFIQQDAIGIRARGFQLLDKHPQRAEVGHR